VEERDSLAKFGFNTVFGNELNTSIVLRGFKISFIGQIQNYIIFLYLTILLSSSKYTVVEMWGGDTGILFILIDPTRLLLICATVIFS